MTLTPEQAKELLRLHSFAHPDVTNPKMRTGFLGSLRPYYGLNEANLHEVMAAIRALAPQLYGNRVDAEIMGALWSLQFFANLWALDPKSMLRRNNLITPADLERLSRWLHQISYAVITLLETNDIQEAFSGMGYHFPDPEAGA